MSLSQWQSSLSAQGAQFDNNRVVHFGDLEQELAHAKAGNSLCDLSHYGLLAVNGEDAVSFLQGQLTNDVAALDSQAHLSGYCNPKGRLLALFLAFKHLDIVHLQLPEALLAPISKRLQMFIMRSKVRLNDTTESLIKFGVSGPDAQQILGKALDTELPLDNDAISSIENITVIKRPSADALTRYEVIAPLADAERLWKTLNQDCQATGSATWDWLEVKAGIPEVYTETQQQFVPQMLNLDLLNGINFKKGCYTGQEIVARTHYLGTVKRRTFLASMATMPQAGDACLDAANSEVGQIVRVAPEGKDKALVLVELRTEAQSAGGVTCNGQAITFNDLPYSLAAETA